MSWRAGKWRGWWWLVAALCATASCVNSSGFAATDRVVIADAQALVASLTGELDRIEGDVAGEDRGVDQRLASCRTALDLTRDAVNRSTSISAAELVEMLEPFEARYGSLFSELGAEQLLGRPGKVRSPEEMSAFIRRRVKEAVPR